MGISYCIYIYISLSWRRKIDMCSHVKKRNVASLPIPNMLAWCQAGSYRGTMPGSQVTYIQVLICVVNHQFFLT